MKPIRFYRIRRKNAQYDQFGTADFSGAGGAQGAGFGGV